MRLSFPFVRISAVFVLAPLSVSSCKKEEAPAAEVVASPLAVADTPVLDIRPGQQWHYSVTIENPDDSRTGAPVEAKFERVRKYLGKVSPGDGQAPEDCFEMSAKGAATLREFVKIEPTAISLTGHHLLAKGSEPERVRFAEPIPFFRAGLQAGDSMPVTVLNKNEKLWRVIRVIAREKVTVPAGEFDTVRLQMVGKDGEVSLRKTYWFAPGKGLIREEKIREVNQRPVMIETDELTAIRPGNE